MPVSGTAVSELYEWLAGATVLAPGDYVLAGIATLVAAVLAIEVYLRRRR